MKVRPVLFVLKGYPRLSETFIAQEIEALEKRGIDIRIASLRHPTDTKRHPIHNAIQAPITYLPEYLHDEPRRVLSAWRHARTLQGYRNAYQVWRNDFARDRTRNRLRRFGQAMVLAAESSPDTQHIHAHFLHTPASVARYAAIMLGLPWSVSAHAKDIWTSPDWELTEKLDSAEWAVTCTQSGAAHLSSLATDPATVSLVYHGLDLSRFPKESANYSQRDGCDSSDPVIILSVGRAVAKKGYEGLLTALSNLPSQIHWRLIHIGGGPELERLKSHAEDLGLSMRIEWRGAQSQGEVFHAYEEADVFVLNSRIAADGDRDGLPNVLMEAQAMGLPCVATNISAIPELITDQETGLLVRQDDPDHLTTALTELLLKPDNRIRLGAAGQARVRSTFSMTAGIDDLEDRFKSNRIFT